MTYPDTPWHTPVYDFVWLGELPKDHPWRQCYGDGFAVVDHGGTEPRVVGCDGGEPEDQSLSRDWKWVVDELRSLQRALESANAECAMLREEPRRAIKAALEAAVRGVIETDIADKVIKAVLNDAAANIRAIDPESLMGGGT